MASEMAAPFGVMHLVVGPSGAGKDTLMLKAAAVRPDIHVARRVITRPEDAGGEAHDAVSDAAFEAMAAAGRFALHWSAHGLRYGIRRSAAEMQAMGRHVLVNASRGVAAEARAQLQPLRILLVEATPETRARRLAARGREAEEAIAERLRRTPSALLEGPDVWRIDNDGRLETGLAAFLAALAPLPSPPPSQRDQAPGRSG